MQLDQGEKGFSFSKEGPLDMRMDPQDPLTASDIVNKWPQDKLEWLFKEYGEEKRWRQAAKTICEARKKSPIQSTKDLADLIASSLGRGMKKKLHPATLIFQALRICVNRELEAVQTAIPKAIQALRVGGRMGILSFHSLEDRIVKTLFKEAAARPVKRDRNAHFPKPLLKLVNKKPLEADQKEIRFNPRARSAKLRFAERI